MYLSAIQYDMFLIFNSIAAYNQSIEKFKVTSNKQNNRPEWIAWQPKQKQKSQSRARLMNKRNWSKPYFNKL